jgi:hypothetical protein
MYIYKNKNKMVHMARQVHRLLIRIPKKFSLHFSEICAIYYPFFSLYHFLSFTIRSRNEGKYSDQSDLEDWQPHGISLGHRESNQQKTGHTEGHLELALWGQIGAHPSRSPRGRERVEQGACSEMVKECGVFGH